jgi:tetratricopeptide (TPR) repeat protein
MTKRKVVMISSTVRDLPNHRAEIRLGCERAGFEPRMMEHLPALPSNAIKASLRLVDEAQIYVGVFAYRYGTIPDGHNIAITEMEYDRAVERDIPRLIFLMHEDHELTRKDIDTGPLETKLEALKERLAKEHVVAFFKSPTELRAQVVESLTALERELDAAEIEDRASATTAAKLHRLSEIPTAPEPFVAHPYTLLQTRELVGRLGELHALTDWAAEPKSSLFSTRVFAITAIGGMGKSALAWKWFRDIAPAKMKPLAGRLWWSFYESDATLENFLIRALAYVSGESEAEVRLRPWRDREDLLIQYLNEKPFLFVLDGLERILEAYTRMNVNALSDGELDRKTAHVVATAVGLPSTAAQSFVGQHRLRQTTDPRAGKLLQRLAKVAESRILITTRLFPSELQLPTGQPRPGCGTIFLTGLSDDDALGLWRTLGVSGSREELLKIFNSVQNHPLLVQALASEVANYKEKPGDFVQWRLNHPHFDPAALPLIQSRTHILEVALQGLTNEAREALKTVVGFRMPANYDALRALLVGDGRGFGTASELDRALTELEDRGLIGWDREANRYDAHPIVRGVVWDQTTLVDRRLVLGAMEAHFGPMKVPDYTIVESIDDLAPAIERYHTLIGLGRFDDAFLLLDKQLEDAMFYRLAAHRERKELFELLFPDGEGAPPVALRGDRSANALNGLAASLHFTGEPGRAVPLFRKSIQFADGKLADGNISALLGNLAAALHFVGHLFEAKSIALAALRKAPSEQEICLAELGYLLVDIGDYQAARLALVRSRTILDKLDNFQLKGVTTAELAALAITARNWSKAEFFANQAERLALGSRFERDLIRVLLLKGHIAVGRGDLGKVDEILHDALSRARAVNMVEFEVEAVQLLAELRFRSGQHAEAKALLDELWEFAERGPYRLLLSDAHCLLAKIESALGNDAAARSAARTAYEQAWCDGPPYAYAAGLKNAQDVLDALGEPYPDLPPFDESKFEPLPDIDINPKDEYWVDPDRLDELETS